jgi:coenzyme F420-reducing hydrogenase delta subunit
MENAVKGGLTYDADAMVLPVKCTGLVKVSYLLKLFAKGMRGVLVLGCDEGDCRYYNGSARCAEIVDETREILDLAGVKPDRLQFHTIAESGGGEAKRVLKGFLKQFGKVVAGKAGGDGGRPKAGVAGAKKKVKKKAKPAKPKARAPRVKKKAKPKKRKAAAGTKRRAGGTGTAKATRKKTTGKAKRKQTKANTTRRKATRKTGRKQATGASKRKKTAATTSRRKAAGRGKPRRGTRTVKARKGK